MAREMKRRVTPFCLDKSNAIDENERIFEAGRQQRQENNKESGVEVASAATPLTEAPTTIVPVVSATPRPAKKTTNGIVVDVPIDDYLALMQMKVLTRRTLKELALQAIHEYVERNKM